MILPSDCMIFGIFDAVGLPTLISTLQLGTMEIFHHSSHTFTYLYSRPTLRQWFCSEVPTSVQESGRGTMAGTLSANIPTTLGMERPLRAISVQQRRHATKHSPIRHCKIRTSEESFLPYGSCSLAVASRGQDEQVEDKKRTNTKVLR